MAKLSVDQTLLKAKFHAKKGGRVEAQKLYQAVLQAFPKNKRAQQGLAGLNKSQPSAAIQAPPQGTINRLINLYNQGQLSATVEQAQSLTHRYPAAFVVWDILGAANLGLGRVVEASHAFTEVTKLDPSYAGGFSNLGASLKEQGKLDEAIEAYDTALSLKPDYAEAHNNRGNALQEQRKLDEAVEAYSKALSSKPDYAEACNNMGSALKAQSKLKEAVEVYQKALSLKPNYAAAQNNMGNALHGQGKLNEAIEAYHKALSLKPDYAQAHNNMGSALQERGRLKEAIEAYNKALSLKPDYAQAYNNMGNALQEQGNTLDEAIEAYSKALSLKPNYAEAHNNMGIALKEQGKLDEAIGAYNKALLFRPDYPEAQNNMGNALHEQGKLDEAIEAYNKALSLKPDYAEAHNNKGNTLKEQNKLDEAIEAYNQALSLKPDYAEAHKNLSALTKYELRDPQVTTVSELLARSDLNDNARCHLHFTRAKMNEDLGDLEGAFKQYMAGGELRKKILAYDLRQDEHWFSQIKNTVPKLKKLSFSASDQAMPHTPIFILGMPRSGTTLVEQIISCHSQVQGAGELPYLLRLCGKLVNGQQDISADALLDVRSTYLENLEKVSGNKPFVTDKMPQNFWHIGLLLTALPEAKVIHVNRAPSATCWSNFKHYFPAKGLGYSYNLDDTVSYFKMYQDLMGFWDQEYCNQIYQLDYDRLTIEQESETRKIIDHLGLDWEDAALSPQDNKRSVKTTSQQQVREKVYKGSSQAWLKFEPYLDGIFDELET